MLLAVTSSPLSAKEQDEIKVIVNDNLVSFDVSPLVVEGRTLVPLRAIFQALEVVPVWNTETQTVIVNSAEVNLILPIGSKQAIVNGSQMELDVPAIAIDGRTLVPVRFIGESLGANVNYDKENKIVIIEKKEVPDVPDPIFLPNIYGLYYFEENVYLSTDQLPEELANAVYWHTIGSENTPEDFFNWYYDYLKANGGIEKNAVSINGAYQNGVYSRFFVLFYNNDFEVIGYTIVDNKSGITDYDKFFKLKIKHKSFNLMSFSKDYEGLIFSSDSINDSPIFIVEKYVNGQIDKTFQCIGGITYFEDNNTTMIGPFVKDNKSEFRVTSEIVNINKVTIEDY